MSPATTRCHGEGLPFAAIGLQVGFFAACNAAGKWGLTMRLCSCGVARSQPPPRFPASLAGGVSSYLRTSTQGEVGTCNPCGEDDTYLLEHPARVMNMWQIGMSCVLGSTTPSFYPPGRRPANTQF